MTCKMKKTNNFSACEYSAIIRYVLIGHIKFVNDMVLEKVKNMVSFNFSYGNKFLPFKKVVNSP